MKTFLSFGVCSLTLALTGCIVVNIGREAPQEETRSDSKPSSQAGRRPVLNIDFGIWKPDPSRQVGPAAVGHEGDYWNTVAVANNNSHTEGQLKCANGEPSPVQVEMINLGGAWGSGGAMGVKSPMLDSYNYPVNNQGGNSQVILHNVPAGRYQVYIYGHGKTPEYFGDYALMVGGHNYGRKITSHQADAIENTDWVEGSQYVRFDRVQVATGQTVEVLIRPGAPVTDNSGRTFADAMICGLQLIPVR